MYVVFLSSAKRGKKWFLGFFLKSLTNHVLSSSCRLLQFFAHETLTNNMILGRLRSEDEYCMDDPVHAYKGKGMPLTKNYVKWHV